MLKPILKTKLHSGKACKAVASKILSICQTFQRSISVWPKMEALQAIAASILTDLIKSVLGWSINLSFWKTLKKTFMSPPAHENQLFYLHFDLSQNFPLPHIHVTDVYLYKFPFMRIFPGCVISLYLTLDALRQKFERQRSFCLEMESITCSCRSIKPILKMCVSMLLVNKML